VVCQIINQLIVHAIYEWCGKLIHDDQFRHRFWASGSVQWALHQSMTAWRRHGSR
jgi:hypothetical protein